MTDKADLLRSLKLERAPEPTASPRRWPLLAGGAAGFLLLAGGGYYLLEGPAGVPVRVAVVTTAAPSATGQASLLDASGYVVARRAATVSAKITGKVVDLRIEEGQHVAEGDVVARLDDTNTRAALEQARTGLAQSQANLAAARVALADAKPIYERQKRLHDLGWVSGSAYDAALASYDASIQSVAVDERAVEEATAGLVVAERNQDDTVVRAPFAGVITVKAAQPGEIVSPFSAGGGFTRTGIGTLVDMQSLEVEVDVSENFIHRVHAGQSATVRLNAYPDWQIPAEVIAVIPTADRAKATVKVRVRMKQIDERVLPEMGARVAFLDEAPTASNAARAPGLLVVADAVQATGDSGVVFVIHDDHVERRAVRLGARQGTVQTLLSGVSSGDRLAMGDLSKLADGTRIRVEETAR